MIRIPTKPALQIRRHEHPGYAVIELEGKLESPLDRELIREIEGLIDRGVTRVIVKCAGLEYLSSHGVSAFIAVLDDLRKADGDLKLVGVPWQADLVLERLGVTKVIQRFAAVEEAIAAFDTPIRLFLYGPWIAAPGGKVYHAAGCAAARRIRSPRPVASEDEARRAGLRSCRRCV